MGLKTFRLVTRLASSTIMVFITTSRVGALLVLTLVLPGRMMADTPGPPSASAPNVSYEKYATTSTGVDLYWTAYVPADGLRHPAVLVLHPSGFNHGDAGPMFVCQDLAAAGFLALATEYRLAPPHLAMNSPSHPYPGQNDALPVQDDGHFPAESIDIQTAIRAARRDPRGNGLVYGAGGSGGGYLVAYMSATGTPGDDKFDLGVSCSGVYKLDDLAHLQDNVACANNETCFHYAITNYFNIYPDPWPTFDSTLLATFAAGSVTTYMTAAIEPLYVMCASNDTGGVDTYDFPDILAKYAAIGIPESTASIPVAHTYKQQIVPTPPPPADGTHAFEYWYFPFDGVAGHPTVATTVINWLQAGPPTSNPPPTQELLNVSTRTQVLGGDSVLIGGFIVTGNIAKSVVLRALGPSLADLGVTGVLANPTLALYDSTGALIQQNDNWISPLPANVVAAGLTPKYPAESLIAATLSPGSYTAVLQGAGGSTGAGLFELYDLDPADSRVINLSSRGQAGSGNQAMIGGVIIGGTQPTEILLRALGPSLTALGVAGALQDPVLELRGSDGSLIAENDNWRDTQEQQIIATTIPPSNDKESAILATLAPGDYTALVSGVGTSSGIALVEVYDLTSN
jgi:hypothetical protein